MNHSLIPKSALDLAKLPAGQISGVVSGFVEIVKTRQHFLQTREVERTKRVQIKEQAALEIAEIRAKTQLMRDYFTMAFAERRENFDRSFTLLDQALASDNPQKIEAALSLITTLIKESPLKQAAEVMAQIKNRRDGDIIDI